MQSSNYVSGYHAKNSHRTSVRQLIPLVNSYQIKYFNGVRTTSSKVSNKVINNMQLVLYNYYRIKCQVFNCYDYNIKAYSCIFYDCLGPNEFHFFCDEHANQFKCPIHPNGERWCEVTDCEKPAKKYTRITYSCLGEGDYHFFCTKHYHNVDCTIHSYGYRRR